MRITTHDDNDLVFESDGKTVSMPTDPIQRSFVFYALMGSLAVLCQVPQMHEITDVVPGPGPLTQ